MKENSQVLRQTSGVAGWKSKTLVLTNRLKIHENLKIGIQKRELLEHTRLFFR